MCGGASSTQKNLAASTGNFYKTLQGAYNEQFANQSSILSNLHNAWTPILNGGPNQQGFSASELADLNSSAINRTAANYKSATQATNEARAARGGGNVYTPSGTDDQVQGEIATKAAQQLSDEQNKIDMANYAQGRQNFAAATGALSDAAKIYDPVKFAADATNTGDQAFKMDTQINAENNSWKTGLFGALTGLAGSAVDGWRTPKKSSNTNSTAPLWGGS